MLSIFIYIFILIGFGVEEIMHEQRESDKRIRENIKRMESRRKNAGHSRII